MKTRGQKHTRMALGLAGLALILGTAWTGMPQKLGSPALIGLVPEIEGWKLSEKPAANEVIVLTPVAHRVRHVHIKDVVGKEAVILGKGNVNLKECLRILKEKGYTGVLSYQTEGSQSVEESRTMIAESRKFMMDALKELS